MNMKCMAIKSDKPEAADQLADDHETGIDNSAPEYGPVEHLRDWDGEADGGLKRTSARCGESDGC